MNICNPYSLSLSKTKYRNQTQRYRGETKEKNSSLANLCMASGSRGLFMRALALTRDVTSKERHMKRPENKSPIIKAEGTIAIVTSEFTNLPYLFCIAPF